MNTEVKKTKKLSAFPDIVGFECFPEGKLLSQRIDFDGPVGIAYERCIGYTKSEHSHDRITITFPRGASRSFIKVFPESKTFPLNNSMVHVMAKDHLHEQGSRSTIYDTFALFVTPAYFEAHLKRLGARNTEIQVFVKTTQSFQRSAVLNELIGRYFFCRVLESSPSPVELAHLEALILTEVFTHGRKASPQHFASKVGLQKDPVLENTAIVRAIEFIESHLFEKLDIPALVRSSRTSQATLFRLFKKELKASPIEYVRHRRLDEAQTLLKTGEYQVSDVALLVGYEELSAFSKAYKERFRAAPSESLPPKAPPTRRPRTASK